MLQKTSLKFKLILAGILLVSVILQVFGALGDSQTIDEAVHLSSGYSYWKTGDFRFNPEHPPLTKLLASAPLLFFDLRPLEALPGWRYGNQWDFGRDFLYHNSAFWQSLLFSARLVMILLHCLLVGFFAIFAKKLFGAAAALLSTAFFALDPTLLGHGRLVTTDTSFTLFFFLTVFAFRNYVGNPGRWKLLVLILAFSAAQLVKFSALFLWPILIALIIIAVLLRNNPSSGVSPRFNASHAFFVIIALLIGSGLLIWAVYGFEVSTVSSIAQVQGFYHAVATEQYENLSGTLVQIPFWNYALNPENNISNFIQSFVHHVPVPALSYFRGIVELGLHNYYGHGTYLFGETSTVGWWYYFPATLFLKLPFAIFLLLLIFTYLQLRRTIHLIAHSPQFGAAQKLKEYFRTRSIQSYVLTLPPLIYFLVSLTSHINLGVRHLLPVFPFLYLTLGYVFQKFLLQVRYGKIYTGALFAVVLLMAAVTYPNHLAYFSEAVGGEKQGPRYVLDSNLDWGQGFLDLKAYLDERGTRRIRGMFFFSGELSKIGIEFERVPTNEDVKKNGPPSGIIAISIGILANPDWQYTWLWKYLPETKIRGSIYIYNLP